METVRRTTARMLIQLITPMSAILRFIFKKSSNIRTKDYYLVGESFNCNLKLACNASFKIKNEDWQHVLSTCQWQ